MRPTRGSLLVVALAALLPSASAGAQSTAASVPDSARLDAVARYVAHARARLGLPSLAVSVATPDRILLSIGSGDGGNGAPVSGETPFLIGSVTKTLTASLIASLAERGQLALDTPVSAVLGDLHMRDPRAFDRITPRHLLTHRSGLRQWDGHDGRAQRDGRFDHLAPRREPGSAVEYSSLNFIIVGRVAERATGKDYAELLHEYVLDPLGMESSFVLGGDSTPRDRARGHQSFFGFQVRRDEPRPPRYLVPAGFVGASATDLGRFGGKLLASGDSAPMSWGRQRVDGRLILEHAGNARTNSARVRLLPGDGLAITVLAGTNSGPFFSSTAQVMDGVQAILDGEDPPTTWPKERLFKGALLLGTAFSLAQLYRQGSAWQRAGRPTRIDGTGRILTPLAIDVGIAGALLLALPRYIGVPLGTMTEYFPDLGVALTVSAVAGVTSGVLRAATRSAERH